MSARTIKQTWSEIKAAVTDRGLRLQFVDYTGSYIIYAFDGPVYFECQIAQSSDPVDYADFEDNYKADANAKMRPTDSDGSELARLKITKSGWGVQCHTMELETSKLASIYEKDASAVDCGWASIKFYDASDVELTTQTNLDSSCVKTVLAVEPDVDIEIIGGQIIQHTVPTGDVRGWLKHDFSGHEFCTGGINFKYVEARTPFVLDGRAPKLLPYNATYHTGLMTLTIRHAVGLKHGLLLRLEIFRA